MRGCLRLHASGDAAAVSASISGGRQRAQPIPGGREVIDVDDVADEFDDAEDDGVTMHDLEPDADRNDVAAVRAEDLAAAEKDADDEYDELNPESVLQDAEIDAEEEEEEAGVDTETIEDDEFFNRYDHR